jgi:hypothetical protein
MSGRYRLQKAHRQVKQVKQDEINLIPGELGLKLGGGKLVEVPNRPGYVYVRLRSNQSEVVQAFNDKVALVYGLPVLVAIDPRLQSRYYIYGRDIGRYVNWGTSSSYLPVHGHSHSFNPDSPGNDIVYVYGRQYMPFAVTPSGSSGAMSAWIYPGTMYRNNQWHYAGGTGTPSLTGYKPTGSTARMVLVFLDDDGNPNLAVGSHFDAGITGSLAVFDYIPTLPSLQDIPLAAIRLVSGTSAVLWDNIYDVRLLVGDASVASGTSSGYATIQNEGSDLTQRTKLNFVGAGLHAYDDASNGVTVVSGSFVPGHLILDDGSALTQRGGLNFVGTNFSVYDDSANGRTIVSGTAVSSSGGHTIQDDGVDQTQRANLNFVGAGFVIYDDGSATIVSGTSVAGSQGSQGEPGIPGGTTLIYDDSVFRVSGTAISFQNGLDVTSTGTVAYVTWTGSSGGDVSSAVILAPNSSTRNKITPTGNYTQLPLQLIQGQTANPMVVLNTSGTAIAGMTANGRLFAYGLRGDDEFVLIGSGAGPASGSASSLDIIAIGKDAAKNTGPIAAHIIAVGHDAMTSQRDGERNIGIGAETLYLNTNGNDNVAIGYRAGKALEETAANTIIGSHAMAGHSDVGAGYNVAVGYSAAINSTIIAGSHETEYNTDVGAYAGFGATWQTYNALIGYRSGYQLASGSFNVYVGAFAGDNCRGSSNVFLGYQAGYHVTGSNMLVIHNTSSDHPLIRGYFAAGKVVFDQDDNDGLIVEFKSSDVAHGMTALVETDSFGAVRKYDATAGGLQFVGYSESTVGALLAGNAVTPDTSKAAGSIGAVMLRGQKKSGTSVGDSGSNENILVVQTRLASAHRALMILDTEGELHLDATVSQNAWDDHDDVALLAGVRALGLPIREQMEDRWQKWMEYARPVLEQTGVVTYNEDGHHFIATKRLNMLQIDAIRQLHEQVCALKSQLQASEDRFNRLMDKLGIT